MHPMHLPELLAMILSFIRVDVRWRFNPGLLRVSRAFYGLLAPRLYQTVNIPGKSTSWRRQLLVACLLARPLASLDALRITHLEFQIVDADRRNHVLERLQEVLHRSDALARSVRVLVINSKLCCATGTWGDGDNIGRTLFHLPGLNRLVLKDANGELMDTLFDAVEHVAMALSSQNTTRRLTLDLPVNALFEMDGEIESLGTTSARFGTMRTLLTGDDSVTASDAAHSLLAVLIDQLFTDSLRCSKLVLGRALVGLVAGASAADKLRFALAERIARDRAKQLGCRVVFPTGLGLQPLLNADADFRTVGLDGVIEQWEEDAWPL